MTERRDARQDQDVVIERRKHQELRPSLPGDMRNGWLTFESKSERRRLAPTPDAWDHLPEAALVSLLADAVSVGRTKRLID